MALRFSSAREALEEALGRVDVDQLDALVAPERLDHLRGLAGAHQPRVDEHAGELGADGAVDQGRGHGGVDPARQRADHPGAAHLGPHRLDARHDHRRDGPRGLAAADVVEEVLQHLLATRRVHHLGVELHAVDPPLDVVQHRNRGLGAAGRHREALGRAHDRVEVAHPHRLVAVQVDGQDR